MNRHLNFSRSKSNLKYIYSSKAKYQLVILAFLGGILMSSCKQKYKVVCRLQPIFPPIAAP